MYFIKKSCDFAAVVEEPFHEPHSRAICKIMYVLQSCAGLVIQWKQLSSGEKALICSVMIPWSTQSAV